MEQSHNVEAENLLAGVRSLAKAEALRVTLQAVQEMDGITLDEVLQAIAHAEIVESYPDYPRGACCLLNGFTDEGRLLDVVCTTAQPVLIVVKAYDTKPVQG